VRGGAEATALAVEQTVNSISIFVGMAVNLPRRYVRKEKLKVSAFSHDAVNSMVLCAIVTILVGPWLFPWVFWAWHSTPTPTHMISLIYLVTIVVLELVRP
jgi:hypothetical protein